MKKFIFALLLIPAICYGADSGTLTADYVVRKPGKTYSINQVTINPDAQMITVFVSYSDADGGTVATEEYVIQNTPGSCSDGNFTNSTVCAAGGGTWTAAINTYTSVIGTQSTAAGQNCAVRLRNAIVAAIKTAKGWQ